MRLLNQTEIERLSVLTDNGLQVGLLEPTSTALGKNIIDAVGDFRDFLRVEGVHDYGHQPKGIENKKVVPAHLLTPTDTFVRADASLYRPTTKDGDPRVWFSRLHKHANGSDIIAIVHAGRGELALFNLTQTDLTRLFRAGGEFDHFMAPYFAAKTSVVDELLGALQLIASKGFIRSAGSADRTVGLLLEAELGIAANSSKSPDYKGIEIKAARAGKANRHNLFARVPDWTLSALKSSQAVLDAFGYFRDGRKQLYCTVNALRPNAQGLFLKLDVGAGLLHEMSDRIPVDVVTWTIPSLEGALAMKHAETFWVKAESRRDGQDEEFRFVAVEHTANPILEQLAPLIAAGEVTLDHLVREVKGRAAERGPIFKLKHGSLPLLFPPSTSYDLASPQ